MADNLNVTTEQVDDIPVLLAQGKKIGVPEILDRHFWPHVNWQGISFGWIKMVWLGHILSEGSAFFIPQTHRGLSSSQGILSQLENWKSLA